MTDKIVNIQAPAITANEPTQTQVNATVSTIPVTAVVATPNITDSVDITNIKVELTGVGEESIPNDSLFKRNQDWVQKSDQIKKATSKLVIDLVSKTDTVTLVANYKRTFVENKLVVELKSFAIGKNLVELKTLQETQQKSVQKVFNDLAVNVEQSKKATGKNVIESQSISELIKLLANKGIVDTTAASDVLIPTMNYYRIFVDAVDATDDFLGLANVDDDQTARIGKNVVDYISNQDLQTFNVKKAVADTQYMQETRQLAASKILLESKIISEIIKLAYSKQVLDQTISSDTFLISLGKSVQEYTTNTDTTSKQIAKVYVDSITKQEQVLKGITKNLQDTASSYDTFTKTFAKIVEDLAASADVIGILANLTKQETTTTSERVVKLANKGLVDTTSTLDAFTRVVNYYRAHTDTVDATDDFLGNANVDDDQIARIGKNIVEYVAFPEVLTFAASKGLLDQVVSQEQTRKALNKIFAEQTVNQDVNYKGFTKPVLETTIAQDQFVRLVNYFRVPVEPVDAQDTTSITTSKRLIDLSTSLDAFARVVQYYRAFTDTSVSSDIKYFTVSKSLADQAANSDTVSKSTNKTTSDQTTNNDSFNRTVNYYRTHTDAVDATDDFLGNANVDDDQTARVGKHVSETATTLELLACVTGKQITDTTGLQEAAAKSVSKPFTDQFTRTDQLYKKPTKVNIDSVIAADVFSFNKTTNLPRLDTFSTTDSGIINNQSYFAGTFATPGYVGTNTIFT